jgi:PmbA protein
MTNATLLEAVLAAATTTQAVAGADAMYRDTDRTELKFEAGRLKECLRSQEAGVNLRLIAHGRIGLAGTTELASGDTTGDLIQRALASAEQGETGELAFPGRDGAPAVRTYDEPAATATVEALAELGRRVVAALVRPGWQVNATVDRTVESTRVINSAGQDAAYQATGVSVAADVTRVSGDDVLMVYDYVALAGIPTSAELDGIVRSVVTRMERAGRVVGPPEGRLPVLFTPNGAEAVLLPLRQALSGKTVLQGVSPLGGRLGETMFDAALSITDDPLLGGRLGARPVDDEGVPSRRLGLVEQGTLRAFVYDLETAARAGAGPTGHGRRSIFGKPGISFSNLVIGAGDADEAALLAAVGDGLVVDELIGVGQGNVISGAFSHPVALAYRVEKGEITGRVKDAAVAGNAYDLLKRIRLLGREARWSGGTRHVPPIVLEGVSVAGR